MTAEDTQNLLVATLSKIAEKKKVEDKKEVMKSKDKKMDSKCDYAEKVAETLDYLHSNFDLTFGSSIQKAIKLASDNPVPNMVHHEASSGPAGRPINETRDSMAVGEEPSSNSKGLGTVAGVPNIVAGTLDKRPGGAPVDPSNPPLMNKSAYSKVLAKLAQNKTAGIEVPNQVRLMDATESGKGQSGYDSGSSHGNGNRSLVNTSNERAMSYTKADAKKSYIKEQVGQVFDEVHPEKDKALDRAFSHGVETAKMAGMSNAPRGALGGALGGAGVGLALVGAHRLMNKHPNGLIPEMLNKSASVTGNMGAGGLIGGGLREGVSSLGGKALGGLAGLATKGTELASDVGQGASAALGRTGELLAGGKKMPVAFVDKTKMVRPGNVNPNTEVYINNDTKPAAYEALKSLGARGAAGAGLLGAGALAYKAMSKEAPEMLNKSASVTGNMGAGGLIGGGLREGVSSLGGKALGGLAGLATKGQALIKENPNAADIAGMGAAALAGRTGANALDLDQNGVGETIGGNIGALAGLPMMLKGKLMPGVVASIGGGLAGAHAGKLIYNNRERALAEQAMSKEAMGIESFNHESSLADTIDSMRDRTKIKQAGIHEKIEKEAGIKDTLGRAGQLLAGGKKMPTMVGNRVKDLRPGNHLGQVTHAANKSEALKSLGARGVAGAGLLGAGALASKEASLVSKGAMLLRKLAEAVPTNMPPQAAAELPAQGGVPPEDAQEMGGQEDQIEKLKKLLLLMQMAKKQEEQQVMQGQSAMPDVASPGGAAANEMAAATSGPAQGIM